MAGVLKWIGRSIDDLVKEGYPESVAKRISSGELPMDFESRMARAAEQGYDMTPEYRGGGLTQIEDPEALFDKGLFSTNNPSLAATYANWRKDGNIMPVLLNRDNTTVINTDGTRWNNINDSGRSTNDYVARVKNYDLPSIQFKDVMDTGHRASGYPLKLLQKAFEPSNVTATLDPSKARSLLSAAFDPEYTGPNILGSRIAPTAAAGLLGAAALTQSEDAEAGLLKWVGRPVDDLVKEGYPESVAKRISSGELPMDFESRMARAAEQGYDPRTYYHGGSRDILNLDTTASSSPKTKGTGTWFTDQPEVANSYLHEGSQMYPVRIKTDSMDYLDAEGSSWASLPSKNLMRDGKQFDDYPEGHTLSSDVIANISREGGQSGVVLDNVVDLGSNYKYPRETKDDWLGWLLDYEQKGGRNVAVQDPNSARSIFAAFDPEYTGPNILGSRMAPTAATGLMALDSLTPPTQDEQARTALEGLMGQYDQLVNRKEDIYNYGELAPVKRNVVSGDYSLAVPKIADDIIRGLLDLGQSRKTGVVNSGQSLLDVLM